LGFRHLRRDAQHHGNGGPERGKGVENRCCLTGIREAPDEEDYTMALDVTVDKFDWDNNFQVNGDQAWNLGPLDSGHYWSFIVIPRSGNVNVCEIIRLHYSTDNSLTPTAHFIIRVNALPGSAMEFNVKGLRAPSV
jgi:hypothetical protein